MERLTDRFDDGVTGVMTSDKTDLISIFDVIEDPVIAVMVQNSIDRLTEYEDTRLTPEEIKKMSTECDLSCVDYKSLEEQGLLINLSKKYSTEEVKEIFHTLMESCYGVPIPKETTNYVVDDLMR